jgi:cysteine synthase
MEQNGMRASGVGESSSAAVGNTDLQRIQKIVAGTSAALYAKCEFKNPTGSHKDRVFKYMLEELELRGSIRPGMRLLECSTGNGGAALAQVGRARGYEVVIIMPRGMTLERKTQIAALGAEIIETDPVEFLKGAEQYARDYVRRHPGSYFLDQSTNELNWQAWRACGRELVTQFQRLGVVPDAFVCSIGTGGTFSGIAHELKEAFPKLRTVAVEVDRSAVLLAKRLGTEFVHQGHTLMGLGPGKVGVNVQEHLIDEIRTVSQEAGWSTMKRLITEEGLFTGPTAGGNVFVAEQVCQALGAGRHVVTVLFDSAWKYFSIWNGNYREYGERVEATSPAEEARS